MSSNNILTSVHGRRLGLQMLSSSVIGKSTGFETCAPGRTADILTGMDGTKPYYSTHDSSAYSIPSYGISLLTTSSVAATTSSIYALDKPIPGVEKVLVFNSSGTATNAINVYSSTDGSICIAGSSVGSTMCCLGSSDGIRSAVVLLGIASTQWMITNYVSTTVIKISTLSS